MIQMLIKRFVREMWEDEATFLSSLNKIGDRSQK